jgi:phosphoribosylglycinamide formyltransferase-1
MNVVVLISGNGSNLQAIIDADIPVTAVISNRPDAYGLKRAATAGIDHHVIDHTQCTSRETFDAALQTQIEQYKPGLIVMAGFMRILSKNFVDHFHGRLINIHPSLLPKHKGLHTHRKALEAHDKFHGISVHYVNNDLDSGPIISQSQFEIKNNDNEDTLKSRIHTLEHKLYPHTIQLILDGKVLLVEDRVVFNGKPLAKSGIMLNL